MTNKCPHFWTVTSECPICLREELNRAYAEIRKQVFATKAVFDREVVERAQHQDPGNRWED
jgi:hypothetical protein